VGVDQQVGPAGRGGERTGQGQAVRHAG
jgi:hypothetical protein